MRDIHDPPTLLNFVRGTLGEYKININRLWLQEWTVLFLTHRDDKENVLKNQMKPLPKPVRFLISGMT
jgi:hypothetical protein